MSGNLGNLKSWRKSLGLTQEGMGEKFKINWKTYSAYETGRISIPLEVQRKFQKAGFSGSFEKEESQPIAADYITREEFAEWRGYWKAGTEKLLQQLEDQGRRISQLEKRLGVSE